MLTEVYSNNFQSNRNAIALLRKIREWKKLPKDIDLATLHKRRDCQISFHDFRHFVKTHNLLLFPAFMLQRALRKKLLSHSFWERCTKQRKELLKANCTMDNLDEINQAENEAKERLSILSIEKKRKGNGRFWGQILSGGTLCERLKNWKATTIAKKALTTAQIQKYVMCQIKTTQGPICERVKAREHFKDEQVSPPQKQEQRMRKNKHRKNNSCKEELNNQGGFRHGSVLWRSSLMSDNHLGDCAESGNGEEIQRGSMISSLSNLLGIGKTKTGRISAIVDLDYPSSPADEVSLSLLLHFSIINIR